MECFEASQVLVIRFRGSNELVELGLDGGNSGGEGAKDIVKGDIGNANRCVWSRTLAGGIVWKRSNEILRKGSSYFNRPARVPLSQRLVKTTELITK